jgi:SAM-dependent methyltransferase
MTRESSVFDLHPDRYDRWFERNEDAFRAEVAAVRRFVVGEPRGIEVGVGTGRFAAALGLRFGVDPSLPMLGLARRRSIEVVCGVAEALPFEAGSFDLALMTTTVCFLEDLTKSFLELARVLESGGSALIGMIDGQSWLGQKYRSEAAESAFYAGAKFHTVREVVEGLAEAGFHDLEYAQTLFETSSDGGAGTRVRSGFGRGGFVVVHGSRRSPIEWQVRSPGGRCPGGVGTSRPAGEAHEIVA